MPGPLILDRYRPLETSGKGGSGTVQICWDTRIQRRVAIKRITIPDTAADGTIPGLAEARTGAMLKHPNIVSVIDFETSGNEAFLIMEAIEGPTLSEVIDGAHRGELDLDIIATITKAVGEALDFAHDNAVLHLDIKPDNILIDHSGHVKVTDFGVSELSHSGGFNQATGGTIGYMPPEQIQQEDLDQRTDGFAFGVVIYEMLTGRNPYNAHDINGSLKRMQETTPDPVTRIRNDIDPAIDAIMASAIHPVAGERFETVLEMVDEILPLVGDPKEGMAKLNELMRDDVELEDEDSGPRRTDFWGRFDPMLRSFLGRFTCGILCWWVAALGLVAMDLLATPYAMMLAGAAGVAGLVLPGIGALAALAFLGAGIIVNPGLPFWLGIIVVVVATAWWGVAGRSRIAAANTTLVIAPLGLVWATPLAPLLAGFTLRPAAAAISALAQSIIVFVLAAITGTGSLQHLGLTFADNAMREMPLGAMAVDPGTWITILSWIIAAVLMSVFCSSQTRVLSIVGAIVGCAVMIAAQVLATFVATGAWGVPAYSWLIAIAGATIVVIVIGALGAPYRHREED